MRRLLAILDNAMLYKDVTQWMRLKVFLFLFFGLLGASEVASVLVVAGDTDPGEAGIAAFVSLVIILGVYMFIIAINAFNRFHVELNNRTFELFEVAGMSLEKMIFGKLLSAGVQYLFGLSAVVPFIFFAYLLGGLDFYVVLSMSALLTLVAPLLFLIALALASLARRRQLSRAGITLGILFLMFGGWSGLIFLLGLMFSGHGALADLGIFAQQVLSLNPAALVKAAIWLSVDFVICLLLFYICCDAISPTTDSRETPVKLLTFLLTTGVTAWILATQTGTVLSELGWVVAVVFIAMLTLGIAYFYGHADRPLMAQRRFERASAWKRFFFRLFAPGAVGTIKVLLLIFASYLLLVVYFATLAGEEGTLFSWSRPTVHVLLPWSVFFFLGMPAVFFTRVRVCKGDPMKLRMAVISWWLAFAIPLVISLTATTNGFSRFESPVSQIIALSCLVFSPLSAIFPTITDTPFILWAGPLRAALGVIGLLFIRDILLRLPRRGLPTFVPRADVENRK